jgi:putative membrane protein
VTRTGAFIATAPEELRGWRHRRLLVHVMVAVLTYVVGTWLAVVSWPRAGDRLPGKFSRRHRRYGTLVFAGLWFTAVSATGMYVLAFVA